MYRRHVRGCNSHPLILRGNHDSVNEKSTEHALGFLSNKCDIFKVPMRHKNWYFIPYQHSIQEFKAIIDQTGDADVIFMHQGVQSSNAGHYIQDKSAIPKEWLKGRRVISGHYHTRQAIDLGDGGQLDYVGNPYSLGFGEVNDPPKGFQVLYSDGSLEFVPTNLRKHLVLEMKVDSLGNIAHAPTSHINPNDILWFKVTGPSDKVCNITKEYITNLYGIEQQFKLDLIPSDTIPTGGKVADKSLLQNEMLDNLIENLQNTDSERKERLKQLWKQFT